MWPDRCISSHPIALAGEQQGIRQGHVIAAPARLQFHRLQLQAWRQFGGKGDGALLQTLQVLLAAGCQRCSGLRQFPIPSIELFSRCSRLEQGIALLQRPRISTPQGKEVRFHVEQTPIDKAPTRFTPATDQRVAARLERHHRQGRAQRTQLWNILPIQTPFPGLPAVT
ncbi:hypothetical protein D3C81_1319130 [compost metagenome]